MLAFALLVAGCQHWSFARDHSTRAIRIFGIGWVSEITPTNQMRSFTIGTLDAGRYITTVNTGAPTVTLTGKQTLTNTPPPPTNSTWTTPPHPPPQTNNPAPPPLKP